MAIKFEGLKDKVRPKGKAPENAHSEPSETKRRPRRRSAPKRRDVEEQLKGTMVPIETVRPAKRELAKQQTLQLYVDQEPRLKAAGRAFDKRTAPMLRAIIDLGLDALAARYRASTGEEIPPYVEAPEL